MTITPIVLVEDRGLLALSISDLLRRAQEALKAYELNGPAQIVASGRGLIRWLDAQPLGSVRLLLLDFSISDGESTQVLSQIREPHSKEGIHAALHPSALVIGWSANAEAADHFHRTGAGAFISKDRPISELVDNIIKVIQRRSAGERWIELR